MDRYFKYRLTFISLIPVVLLSLVIVASPVSATSATAPPNSISVPQGGVFLLRGSITFDKSATGYFIWGPVYWYHYGDPAENFCLENTPSVYWEDGTPIENMSINDFIVGNIGWQVVIGDNGDGIERNGTFYVDIWLRAASPDGTPHRPTDNHTIYFGMDRITMFEPTQVTEPAGPITVQVTNIVKLENLYKVSLEKDLKFHTGSKLVVKFYKYDNTFQTESIVDNITPPYPHYLTENENVPHPRGAEGHPWGTVQKVELVLVNNTEEVISTLASFTVHRSHLMRRDFDILIAWGGNPQLRDAFREEDMDILRQWSSAPPC